MKFIVRSKPEYGIGLKKKVTKLLEDNGVECTAEIEPNCDFAVLVGGDGTLLNDHSMMDCPTLGINPGESVGHYMKATDFDYEEKLKLLLYGKAGKDYHVHELLRLEARINGKPLEHTALNEFLISPIYIRRLLETELSVGNVRSYEMNSGIIAYTPSGSTAFAASVGAKPVRWNRRRFGIIAIAPYAGRLKRGEVSVKDKIVTVECRCKTGDLCIDGNEKMVHYIKSGDVVTIRRHPKPFKFIDFKRESTWLPTIRLPAWRGR